MTWNLLQGDCIEQLMKVYNCEDMDFSWYPWEVQQVISSYNNGKSLVDIAIELDRDSDECFILLLDLARQGKIKARQGWIWGAEFV